MADIGVLVGGAQTAASGLLQVKSIIDKLAGKQPPQPGPGPIGSLSAFRSHFIQTGILRSNKFLVQFSIPRLFVGSEGEITRQKTDGKAKMLLPFVCVGGNIPGVSLATSEVRRHGVGPMEKRPYTVNFVDLNLNFLVDSRGIIHQFFREWIDGIVRFDRLITNQNEIAYQQPYEVEYRHNYVTDFEIFIYNDKLQKIYIVKLLNAFPVYMGDISLNWGATDDYVMLPVSFSYTSWTSEILDISNEASSNRPPGLFEKLIAAGSALNLLANIKRPTSIADVFSIVNNTSTAVSGLQKIYKQ
jgi:hypothetical protein